MESLIEKLVESEMEAYFEGEYMDHSIVRGRLRDFARLIKTEAQNQVSPVTCWKPSDVHPYTERGKWSDEVVCVTNYGDVFMLKYFSGEDGGCWQRAHRFNVGEVVAWWCEKPNV